MLLNSGRGISTRWNSSINCGAWSRKTHETPMLIFAGSEHVPMGFGLFGSIRVSQAFWSNAGSSSRIRF